MSADKTPTLLVLHTGGTIGMRQGPRGFAPAKGALLDTIATTRQLHDPARAVESRGAHPVFTTPPFARVGESEEALRAKGTDVTVHVKPVAAIAAMPRHMAARVTSESSWSAGSWDSPTSTVRAESPCQPATTAPPSIETMSPSRSRAIGPPVAPSGRPSSALRPTSTSSVKTRCGRFSRAGVSSSSRPSPR